MEGFLKIRGVRIEEGCRGLDNRTELDRTVWGDMVGQPHRARANRLAVCIPIGVDDEEFGSTPLFDDEPAEFENPVMVQRIFVVRIASTGSVDVMPHVVHAFFDKEIQIIGADQFTEIALGDTCRDAGEESCSDARAQPRQRSGKHIVPSTPEAGFRLKALDADERGDIAQLCQPDGDFVGQRRTVGEELEIGLGMGFEEGEKIRVKERLAAENPEERRTVFPCAGNDPVQLRPREGMGRIGRGHPTTPAPQVAAARDGEHQKGGEKGLPLALPPFKRLDRPIATPGEPKKVDHDASGTATENPKQSGKHRLVVLLEQAQFPVFEPFSEGIAIHR